MRTDEETQQTIIAGMGELHLEIILDRLRREFKVEANVGKPQVAYKEAITKTVEKQGKFVRQSGGKGQYGDIWLKVEPQEPGTGFVFEWKIVGGKVPKEYAKAVQQGIEESSQSGVLAGFPVLDFKVTAFDGSYHDVDSSEMAFKIAASMGWKEANRAAGPILLEPIMKVEVTTPNDYLGAITGDLNRRRGHDPRHRRSAGRRQGDHGQRAALRNVRLRDRHAFRNARPRDVHDGVRALRKGAADGRRRDRRQVDRQESYARLSPASS